MFVQANLTLWRKTALPLLVIGLWHVKQQVYSHCVLPTHPVKLELFTAKIPSCMAGLAPFWTSFLSDFLTSHPESYVWLVKIALATLSVTLQPRRTCHQDVLPVTLRSCEEKRKMSRIYFELRVCNCGGPRLAIWLLASVIPKTQGVGHQRNQYPESQLPLCLL